MQKSSTYHSAEKAANKEKKQSNFLWSRARQWIFNVSVVKKSLSFLPIEQGFPLFQTPHPIGFRYTALSLEFCISFLGSKYSTIHGSPGFEGCLSIIVTNIWRIMLQREKIHFGSLFSCCTQWLTTPTALSLAVCRDGSVWQRVSKKQKRDRGRAVSLRAHPQWLKTFPWDLSKRPLLVGSHPNNMTQGKEALSTNICLNRHEHSNIFPDGFPLSGLLLCSYSSGFSLFVLFFWDWVPLCSPHWHGTRRGPPASSSHSAGIRRVNPHAKINFPSAESFLHFTGVFPLWFLHVVSLYTGSGIICHCVSPIA